MNESLGCQFNQGQAHPTCRASVLAITSGKGGVGKTNVAANLSICLSRQNQRVLLMDADPGLGNIDVVMNLSGYGNLGQVIAGNKRLEDVLQPGPCGVKVICGGAGIERLANLNEFERHRLIEELGRLQEQSDIIVIDTGAGICESVICFCLAADHTLVVTTPEPTAMTDAYVMIKVLAGRQYRGRISLLVNQSDSVWEGKKTYRHIADVAGRFLGVGVYEAGILCRDEHLVRAVRRRSPVVVEYPRAPISIGFAAISSRLSGGIGASSTREGFFRKAMNWLF